MTETVPSTVNVYGRCQCDGWGVVGARPNVRFCDCPVGRSLQQDIQTWKFTGFGKIKADGRGKEMLWDEYWTPESWLQFANRMPVKQMGRRAMPGAALGLPGTLQSGSLPEGLIAKEKAIREPGDESEYGDQGNP